MNELEDGGRYGRPNTDMGAYISVGRREEERKGVREQEKMEATHTRGFPYYFFLWYATFTRRWIAPPENYKQVHMEYTVFCCPTFILWLSQDKGASIMQLNGKKSVSIV